MPGSTPSNADPAAGLKYLGGDSARRARDTVSRASPSLNAMIGRMVEIHAGLDEVPASRSGVVRDGSICAVMKLQQRLSAVPRRLVWDNEAGIGRGGRLAEGVAGFTVALATKIVQLKP